MSEVHASSTSLRPAESLRALLSDAIDYAGLFPPAKLDMRAAVANFGRYLHGGDAWALGRFVVLASRLAEFRDARHLLSGNAVSPTTPWRLSILLGADVMSDLAAIHDFMREHSELGTIDCIEGRLGPDGDNAAARIRASLPNDVPLFLEIPSDADPRDSLRMIRDAGAFAKIRTGGVTPEMFPTPSEVARFIARCAELGVAFKATAGLHHPIRARYRLTYEPDSPTGTMYGFLNVLVAAALQRGGASSEAVLGALEVERMDELQFADRGVRWHNHRLDTEALREARSTFVRSIGSCSFEEPLHDLRELALV